MEKTRNGIILSFLHAGVFVSLLVAVVFGFMTAFGIIDHSVSSGHLDWYSFTYHLRVLPESSAFLAVAFGVLVYLSRRLRSFSVADYRDTVWFSVCHAIFSLIVALSVTVIAVSLALFLKDLFGGVTSVGQLFKSIFAAGVGAMIFYYYRGVSRAIWHLHASEERSFVISVAVLVVLLVLTAVFIVNPLSRGSVQETHETLEIVDAVDADIRHFFREHSYLPASLDAAAFLYSDEVFRQHVWKTPLGDRFTYKRTGNSTYQLCASFDALPRGIDLADYPYGRFSLEETGEQCFDLDARKG